MHLLGLRKKCTIGFNLNPSSFWPVDLSILLIWMTPFLVSGVFTFITHVFCIEIPVNKQC